MRLATPNVTTPPATIANPTRRAQRIHVSGGRMLTPVMAAAGSGKRDAVPDSAKQTFTHSLVSIARAGCGFSPSSANLGGCRCHADAAHMLRSARGDLLWTWEVVTRLLPICSHL